jgi:hypothetical protein
MTFGIKFVPGSYFLAQSTVHGPFERGSHQHQGHVSAHFPSWPCSHKPAPAPAHRRSRHAPTSGGASALRRPHDPTTGPRHEHGHGQGGQTKPSRCKTNIAKRHETSVSQMACTWQSKPQIVPESHVNSLNLLMCQAKLTGRAYNHFMAVWTLGLNHTTAPLDLRGRFAFAVDKLPPTLQGLRRDLAQRNAQEPEAAILVDLQPHRNLLRRRPGRHRRHPALAGPNRWRERLKNCMPTPICWKAMKPLAMLSRGQRPGLHGAGRGPNFGSTQRRRAGCRTSRRPGQHPEPAFQRSFAVAKEVRSSTEIGAHSISMAAASVRLASQLFEDLKDIRILFVGAGEMIELVADPLCSQATQGMAIANRSLDRRIAGHRFGAEVMRFGRSARAPARV